MSQAFHRTFKAKRTEYNGILYDSKAEAQYAMELDLELRAGKVAWWLRQVTVTLGIPEHTYRVDFVVGRVFPGSRGILFVVGEDVKAIETREFRKHKRLWRRYGPFPLRIIKSGTVEVITPGEEDSDDAGQDSDDR